MGATITDCIGSPEVDILSRFDDDFVTFDVAANTTIALAIETVLSDFFTEEVFTNRFGGITEVLFVSSLFKINIAVS